MSPTIAFPAGTNQEVSVSGRFRVIDADTIELVNADGNGVAGRFDLSGRGNAAHEGHRKAEYDDLPTQWELSHTPCQATTPSRATDSRCHG
jgi:hypothetical protein